MANGRQKIWVSDIVGDDYKKWKNEFVIFDCATGSGKSYFALHVLGNYASKRGKRILYLCNRKKLRKKIYNETKKLDLLKTIAIKSYQSLQKGLMNGALYSGFDYIVADECHYFTTDAKFNESTDVSYNFLMKQKDAVILWVSATAKGFFKYLSDKGKVKKKYIYRMDKDYSYVKKLYIYQKKELTTIIDDILENELDSKIVVFCNSADRMAEMNAKYGDAAHYFCSSTSTDQKLKKICGYQKETKKIPECIFDFPDGRITFDKRILFTTIVLDNGVDLKDKKIKHIFTEIFDIDSMIQSLGRKRSLDADDTCTFYIREFTKNGIQGLLNKNEAQLKPARLYKESYEEFFAEYGNGKKRWKINKNDIFYSFFQKNKISNRVKINECRYRKYDQDNNIMIQMKELGYVPVVYSFLGEELAAKGENIVVDVKQIDLFLEYLKSIEGKWLFQSDRDEVRKEFKDIGVKLRYTGINTFNGALEDIYKDLYFSRFYNKNLEGKYYVDARRKLEDGSDNPNRYKKYWILEQRT